MVYIADRGCRSCSRSIQEYPFVLLFFVFSIAMGDIWGLGGSSVISRLLGQKQDIKAGGVSAFCLYSSLAMGLLFMAVMLLLNSTIAEKTPALRTSAMHHTPHLLILPKTRKERLFGTIVIQYQALR